MPCCSPRLFGFLLALLLAGLPLGPALALPPVEPLRRCQALLPGFVQNPVELRSQTAIHGPDEPAAVRFDWLRPGEGGAARDGYIVCYFLPRTETGGAWQLHALDSDRFGRLERYDIQQLHKLIRQSFRAGQRPALENAADPATLALVHGMQQAINAASLGALYGLVAVGFTLAFAVSGVFNLAFGTIFTLGAFQAFFAYGLGQRALGDGWFALVPLLLLWAAVGGGAASWAGERLAFGPILRRAEGATARQATLVAAAGLLILQQEGLRLLQGPKTRWLPYRDGGTWTLLDLPGFPLVVSRGHLAVLVATLLLVVGLSWLLRRTRGGLALRAVADDPGAAALLGVSVSRVVGGAYLLAGALAGVAGAFAFLHYGAVNFHIGLLMGFKALTAAILGGIGSVAGALAGGFLVAAVEALAAGLGLSAWKDVLVFLLLCAVLILRPTGLFGVAARATPEETGPKRRLYG